jgi:hypothetical protein
MTKEQLLDMMMLLSALESWGFSDGKRMPDYLLDRLVDTVEILRVEVLK